MTASQRLPFVICDKKGESFWVESSHVLRGKISIGLFYLLRDVVKIYVLLFSFFLDTLSSLYISLVTIQ